METKAALGLGIAALVSGIVLIAQQRYAIGIPGAIVGLWLALQNAKKLRDQSQ
ncbi:MAG: hypothetical protein GKS06_08955 [Acidobacteria bacterium]|nr:hypothetical protein [Acidobacteriota bacterium]